MKILYSPASPYSNKVRMAAHYLGVKAESVLTDTNAEPAELVGNNPLGKIPTLLLDDGRAIYDSRAIMSYLDRNHGKALYPRNADRRTEAEVLEALCDGICDSLLSIVYERRVRPAEMVYEPWIDRQWTKVERGLDYLNANLPKTGAKLHAGHFALAAMLRYIELRFEGKWQKGRPKLKKWPEKFAKSFPDYDTFKA